jgi:tol-pal system-associated acyl-CoA thioesterase
VKQALNAPEFSFPLRVYIEDTDAGGIVYYVNYLKFMERARTELMRSLGFGKDFIFTSDLMFVVQDVSVQYMQPAGLDDELQVTARPLEVGAAYMLLEQRVLRGDELLVEGKIKIVCVDKHSLNPKRMPKGMLKKVRSYCAGENT